MALFDTHCHLNDVEAFPDPASVIAEAREAGVERMVVIGVDIASSRLALGIAERHEGVFASAGLHPNYASDYEPGQLVEIEQLLCHPKCVALGEIGLDLHWEFATIEQQRRALRDQLELAETTGTPVIFHCRDAYAPLLDILEASPPRRFVMHCFSGDERDAARARALGAYYGFDGPLTFKKNEALRALAATLPRDRILIETDSPWLTPHPHRGKRNRPAWLPLINEALAAALCLSADECAALTTANAERFFGLER